MLTRAYFSLLTFFLFSLLISCNHADQLPFEEIVLDFNESKLSKRGDFQIRFKKIDNDSRCPSDGICNWPGLGVVIIEFVSNDIIKERTLNVNEMIKYFESTNFKDREITLLELAPYPVNAAGAVEEEDYQIKVRIE